MGLYSIREGNELIADFMDDYEYLSYKGVKGNWHKDWNELMKVLKKMEDQGVKITLINDLEYMYWQAVIALKFRKKLR